MFLSAFNTFDLLILYVFRDISDFLIF